MNAEIKCKEIGQTKKFCKRTEEKMIRLFFFGLRKRNNRFSDLYYDLKGIGTNEKGCYDKHPAQVVRKDCHRGKDH